MYSLSYILHASSYTSYTNEALISDGRIGKFPLMKVYFKSIYSIF